MSRLGVGVAVVGLLVLAMAAMPSFAQTGGNRPVTVVTATIVASETGQPLAGADVTVRRVADSVVVATATSDQAGRVRIEGLAFGRYLLAIRSIGWVPLDPPAIELTAASPTVDLGQLKAEPAPVTLDAVEATAERPAMVIEADRTTYDAKQLPASSGGTATELLRQIPELEVDINGKVALRGNQSVAMQLNGRPLPMTGEALNNYLSQFPADRIAKVEVMTNPSAAHDPSGGTGIVNLILRENVDLGLSGNVAINGSTRGTKGFNGRLAYQRGNFTFFGGGSYSFNDSRQDIRDVRTNLLANPITILEQDGSYVYDSRYHNFDLSAEYKLTPKTVVWLTGMGYGNGSDNDRTARYGLYDEARVLLDEYDRISESDYGYGMSDFAVGFKHSFVPQRHELIFDLRRSANDNESGSNTLRVPLFDPDISPEELRLADSNQSNPGMIARADYNRPWGERGRVSVGVTLTRRDIDNRIDQSVYLGDSATPDDQTASRYTYQEDYNAAYATVSQTFGKVSAQVGLRYELTSTFFELPFTDQSFDDDYRSVFPSLALTWTAWQGGSLRLNYSKRIMRPYPDILNPFVPVIDPLNISIGNPELDAAYTHSLSFNASHTGSLWTFRVAPSYAITRGSWESIKRVDSLGVSTVTWENSRSNESFGATLTASMRPLRRLSGSTTLSVRRTVTDAKNISAEYSRASTRISLGGNASYRLKDATTGTVSASYVPAYDLPQGRRTASFMTSLSLRHQLLGNRGILSLRVTDPFDIYRYRYETRDRTHVQTSRTSPRTRSATLSFTWNFGRPPQQNSRSTAAGGEGAPVIIR